MKWKEKEERGRERRGRGRETHTGEVVAVDHDGVPAIEVDVLLPPVCDVVVGPPRFEVEVELELLTRAILRRGGEGRQGEARGKGGEGREDEGRGGKGREGVGRDRGRSGESGEGGGRGRKGWMETKGEDGRKGRRGVERKGVDERQR